MVLIERRQVRRLWCLLGAAALLILWLGQGTDIDLVLADAVFDRQAMVFPWRHAWLTETLNHSILKALAIVLGLGWIAYAAADLGGIAGKLDTLGRMRLRIVALAALAVPLATSLLKQASTSHCPWDLARYGGSQPYVRLLEAFPAALDAGHCLPAGHASSALWLISLAVYCLPHQPRRAALVAMGALGLGAAMGYLQQMRGAHFLTHTLWSAWIAAALVMVLIVVIQRAADSTGTGEIALP